MAVVVENFAQVRSQSAVLKLELIQNEEKKEIGKVKLSSLAPYAKTNVTLPNKVEFERGKSYDFLLTIRTADDVVSSFNFAMVPVK